MQPYGPRSGNPYIIGCWTMLLSASVPCVTSDPPARATSNTPAVAASSEPRPRRKTIEAIVADALNPQSPPSPSSQPRNRRKTLEELVADALVPQPAATPPPSQPPPQATTAPDAQQPPPSEAAHDPTSTPVLENPSAPVAPCYAEGRVAGRLIIAYLRSQLSTFCTISVSGPGGSCSISGQRHCSYDGSYWQQCQSFSSCSYLRTTSAYSTCTRTQYRTKSESRYNSYSRKYEYATVSVRECQSYSCSVSCLETVQCTSSSCSVAYKNCGPPSRQC